VTLIDLPGANADNQPPTLSVLVCTYRRPDGIEALLAALVPQVIGNPAREIVVVNDGTHSAQYEAALEPFMPFIRYHPLEENVGVAAARNVSASLARKDYIVFTDDDTVPPSSWLDWLSMLLIEHPELDVVAGTTVALLPDKPGFLANVRATHRLLPSTEDSGGTIIFATANVAIRRKLFEDLGGFGFPDFVGAGEDTELATRLSRRGVRSKFDPGWTTQHEVSESFLALCRRFRHYGFANGKLALMTTSPVEHDYMLDSAQTGWRTIWNWEYKELIAQARRRHQNKAVATLSAATACLVKMCYWRGVKDAVRLLPV